LDQELGDPSIRGGGDDHVIEAVASPSPVEMIRVKGEGIGPSGRVAIGAFIDLPEGGRKDLDGHEIVRLVEDHLKGNETALFQGIGVKDRRGAGFRRRGGGTLDRDTGPGGLWSRLCGVNQLGGVGQNGPTGRRGIEEYLVDQLVGSHRQGAGKCPAEAGSGVIDRPQGRQDQAPECAIGRQSIGHPDPRGAAARHRQAEGIGQGRSGRGHRR